MGNKKMLIDSGNLEEMRIAIIHNNTLESYDFEVNSKEEVKGNIYLAKVTRVEPSLQAAFLEYGRDKQGFLPFSEISIEYFNLPESTKEKLKEEEAKLKALKNSRKYNNQEESSEENSQEDGSSSNLKTQSQAVPTENPETPAAITEPLTPEPEEENTKEVSISKLSEEDIDNSFDDILNKTGNDYFMDLTTGNTSGSPVKSFSKERPRSKPENTGITEEASGQLTNQKLEDYIKEDSGYGSRFGYKIQDVLNKNTYILVQVVKDERGNKGAFLTTYLSIPGRYCVLMPNNYNVDGGISRKIVNLSERQRLKNILSELELPKNHSLIIRTAGIDKTKEEIRQDFTYITNLWASIEERAKKNQEPGLIYEEGNLVKKIIRDSLTDEIAEIYIDGKNTYQEVVDFAKLITPDIVKRIKLFKGRNEGLFQSFGIEEQVRSVYSPIVFLRSGGYIVISPTEALTAIDINSGKFKGNRNVEETALKNNLEATAEIAKQLRLRNIGGLIVIDFIDMENSRNKSLVEKKLKEELKFDKAKIQVGQISNFGLLEMARQHVKSSLFEKSFTVCSKCQGIGYVRPLELNALQILRSLSLDIHKQNHSVPNLKVSIPTQEAFYILNHKRDILTRLEQATNVNITIECNDNVAYPFYTIEEIAENKVENTSVLLLETEIANNKDNLKESAAKDNAPKEIRAKFIKNNNSSNNNFNKYNKNNFNKKNNYKRNFNNKNNHNNQATTTDNKQKKGWIRKLLNI